jgi:predicted nucleic acid-binding protein
VSVVLDANIMIALLEPHHVHHAPVLDALGDLEPDARGKIAEIHRLTLAEVLVGYPDPAERVDIYDRLILGADLRIANLEPDEEVTLLVRARLRAGVKMPDACVLATAMWFDEGLMTFDKRLAGAAAKVGVPTVDLI